MLVLQWRWLSLVAAPTVSCMGRCLDTSGGGGGEEGKGRCLDTSGDPGWGQGGGKQGGKGMCSNTSSGREGMQGGPKGGCRKQKRNIVSTQLSTCYIIPTSLLLCGDQKSKKKLILQRQKQADGHAFGLRHL